MAHTYIDITVGDTGFVLSGTLAGGGLSSLTGCTVTLSLLGVDKDSATLRRTGKTLVDAQAATIVDATAMTVKYQFQTPDVAAAFAGLSGLVRWTVTLPSAGGQISFPGRTDAETVVTINA